MILDASSTLPLKSSLPVIRDDGGELFTLIFLSYQNNNKNNNDKNKNNDQNNNNKNNNYKNNYINHSKLKKPSSYC